MAQIGDPSDVEVDISVKAKEDLDYLIKLVKMVGGQVITVAEDYIKVILRKNSLSHFQNHPKVQSVSEVGDVQARPTEASAPESTTTNPVAESTEDSYWK